MYTLYAFADIFIRINWDTFYCSCTIAFLFMCFSQRQTSWLTHQPISGVVILTLWSFMAVKPLHSNLN